jgi:hypothetical protein
VATCVSSVAATTALPVEKAQVAFASVIAHRYPNKRWLKHNHT